MEGWSLVQVGLFITCLCDTFYPRTGAAVVAVLRHFGCEVRFPLEQTCCGQPAYNNGLPDDARPLVRRLAKIFAGDEHVVSPSASCTAMLKLHGPELFASGSADRELVDAFAAKLRDFNVFLTEALDVDPSPFAHDADGRRMTYHYPCHHRGMTDSVAARNRAHRLLGDQFVSLERFDQCCGFGGAFAVEHAPISGAMLVDKLSCIDATGADVLICDEIGCRMNIEGGLHRRGSTVRVVHSAEIIAESLGLDLPEVA
jgi:L-lactate dehydrogenase complex protein LldE